ncbi:MAG TPA: hypothetical protein VI195_03630 [Steroidobacteraceae bacterium]|nr:hypothetical protein [Steroidobacteraceae bacterium]
MHLGPDNALKSAELLGGGSFLPVHWGTFSLAMHAWDQPPERLLELAPRSAARIMMPRLGEAVEPAHASGRIDPWWRSVDSAEQPLSPSAGTLPATVPWPID